jgi:hypothetical protein
MFHYTTHTSESFFPLANGRHMAPWLRACFAWHVAPSTRRALAFSAEVPFAKWVVAYPYPDRPSQAQLTKTTPQPCLSLLNHPSALRPVPPLCSRGESSWLLRADSTPCRSFRTLMM